MCGKGTEKTQMAERLMSGCGAPFWRISAAHGWKMGSSTWKKVKVFPYVTAVSFLEDLGRSRLEKRSSTWKKVKV